MLVRRPAHRAARLSVRPVIGWYPQTATQCTSRHFVHFGTYVSSSRSRSDLRGQTITTAILWAAHEQMTRLTAGDEIELLGRQVPGAASTS
jgi:hypothetical protein